MKAIVYTRYGSPDVLELKEVAKPAPRTNEVLVKIHAASANPADWHLMRGAPFLARLGTGFRQPKNQILGLDIAGTVEAVGSGVTQVKPGDEVFGCISGGGFAEYVSVPAEALALKPANLSFEQAASVGVVAFTTLQGLRDFGHIQAGHKVLINGASGGIGTFAVQVAKSYGAEVTGVCSTRNLDLVRSIGADHVVDYTRQDFTTTGQKADLLLDTVANRSALAYRRALNPNGRCVIAGFTTLFHLITQAVFMASLLSMTGSKKIALMGVAKPNPKDLAIIKELLDSGKVVPVIDRSYPLDQTADAIRYLEQGHGCCKVIRQTE